MLCSTCLTFFHTKIRDEYKEAHNENPTVEANDVFFALHACVLTSITLIQIYLYDRGDQRFATWSKVATLGFLVFIAIYVPRYARSAIPMSMRNLRNLGFRGRCL